MKNPTDDPWYNEQVELGYNYRMTDFQAALGTSQLKKLDSFKARRTEIVNKYNEAFKDIKEIFVQKEIPESDTARHLYILNLNLEKLTCTRREFFDALSAENIGPQVHYLPVYRHSHYEALGYPKGLCPNAEHLYERILSLPLCPLLSDEDEDDVIKAVKKLINYYRK